MRHLIPISGKDSLATALLQVAREPDLPYEYLFNDTGQELPETYAWLDKVEARLGVTIERVGEDLEKIIRGYDILPSHRMRFCTREAKIQPMERFAGDEGVRVYFGLRADESSRVGYRSRKGIEPVYPLREMGIDLRGVWTILQAQDLLPPSFYWPAIEERVDGILEPGWKAVLEPWEYATLFAGRSRGNCYFCFYQRQYEIVWLADTHPDLFEKARELEDTVGGDDFTWLKGYRLDDLIGRADEIKDRRATAVAKIIGRKMQAGLFTIEESDLAATSCGLLCGK